MILGSIFDIDNYLMFKKLHTFVRMAIIAKDL